GGEGLDGIDVRRVCSLVGGVLVGDVQVLQHAHAREGLGDLEAPHDAEPRAPVRGKGGKVVSFEENAPAVGGQGARDAVDERGLAGAVGSDQPEALSRIHVEAHAVESGEPAEALDHTLHLEEGCGHHQRLRRRRTRPRMPSGASTTKATSTMPTMKRFISEEIVTGASCRAEPRGTGRSTGPTRLGGPPIRGMASAFTG